MKPMAARSLVLALVIALLMALPHAVQAEDAPKKDAPNKDVPKKGAPEPVCAKDATFEKVSTGYRFTEGPAADPAGNIYFSDIPNERIHRLDVATGKVTVFRENSGRSNGLMFGPNGRLVACEGGARRVARIEADGKQSTTLASHWERTKDDGTKERLRLNSPNDLAIDAHGGLWFTDPRYGRRQDDREIATESVYYLDAKGVVHQRIVEITKPNGIALAPDGRTLYVAASRARRVHAYPVTAPGVVGKGRIFANLDLESRGGPDGMCLDVRGNLYAAGQGRIWVWDRTGRPVIELPVPEGPANVTFGGPKRRTLYVTARTSLYRMPMLVQGAPVIPRAPADGVARPQGGKPGQ